MIFTTWSDSIKTHNIHDEPRVRLCVDDEEPPFALDLMEGLIYVGEHDPDLRHWTTRTAGRFMGEDLAGSRGDRKSVEGELLLGVTPDRIVTRKNVSG